MNDADLLGGNSQDFARDLCHRRIGALSHVDGSAVEPAAAVAVEVHDRDRRGRRDHRLERDRHAAAAAQRAAAARKGLIPLHLLGDRLKHRLDRRIPDHRARRLGTALAQDVAAPEFDRVDLELPCDQVRVALVGPNELRNPEAAQGARRREVRVDGVRVDADVVDVVRSSRRKARLLRHARADVGVRAAVPPDLALARGEAAVLRHPTLDARVVDVLGDHVELLFHCERDLHGTTDEHREGGDERSYRSLL